MTALVWFGIGFAVCLVPARPREEPHRAGRPCRYATATGDTDQHRDGPRRPGRHAGRQRRARHLARPRRASVVVAWNVEYDRRLLHQTAKRHGLTLPVRTWRCAMEAETTTRGPAASYAKLADVAGRLGVSAAGDHSALVDPLRYRSSPLTQREPGAAGAALYPNMAFVHSAITLPTVLRCTPTAAPICVCVKPNAASSRIRWLRSSRSARFALPPLPRSDCTRENFAGVKCRQVHRPMLRPIHRHSLRCSGPRFAPSSWLS